MLFNYAFHSPYYCQHILHSEYNLYYELSVVQICLVVQRIQDLLEIIDCYPVARQFKLLGRFAPLSCRDAYPQEVSTSCPEIADPSPMPSKFSVRSLLPISTPTLLPSQRFSPSLLQPPLGLTFILHLCSFLTLTNLVPSSTTP